jgi:hypothetical protein
MEKSRLGTSSEHRRPWRGLRRIRRLGGPSEGKTPDTKANVRASGLVMMIALALMALFNSSGLSAFARDLPDGRLTDELVMRSDQWHALMVAWGPAQARPAVRDLFEGLRAMRW